VIILVLPDFTDGMGLSCVVLFPRLPLHTLSLLHPSSPPSLLFVSYPLVDDGFLIWMTASLCTLSLLSSSLSLFFSIGYEPRAPPSPFPLFLIRFSLLDRRDVSNLEFIRKKCLVLSICRNRLLVLFLKKSKSLVILSQSLPRYYRRVDKFGNKTLLCFL
jgi:hypothetical protein